MGIWPSDFITAFSACNIDEVLSYFADDIFYEEVVADGVVARGKQELRARIQRIFDAFPDIKLELNSHFSSGKHDCVE
jgi:ketosteroid isomerase-like protein